MIDSLLHARLQPVIDRRNRTTLWRRLAVIWALAALAAWAVVASHSDAGGPSRLLPAWITLAACAASAACWWIARFHQPDARQLARELESRHHELDGRLLTAVQQVPDKKGEYSFLQERLFEDAVRHSVDRNWEAVAPTWHVTVGRAIAAVAALATAIAMFAVPAAPPSVALASTLGGETTSDGVTVTPGDASLERGSSLTVMVRFDQRVPAAADLVIGAAAASERRVPLVRSLSDPVFGGTVAEVTEAITYRIDYGGRRTRDFVVTVFEHPRLERSNADLTPPAYTRLPAQRIEDTRRISAVEGTRLSLDLHLNKPVATATLVPRDATAPTLTLVPDPERPVVRLTDFALTSSQSYDLKLVDADGRSNKVPDLFVLDALPNRTPELKLATPRGDQRPSALQEISFDGTAWDDFGVLAYGIGLSRGGDSPELIQLGQDVPAQETVAFHHMLRMEALGAKPDDLYSWFVWADDIGPDGERRRTQGDLFFAEVRPFDEIFRQGAGMEGGEPQESPPGGEQGSPATRLAELQKQIINATWNLQRKQADSETYPEDATVVRDSQTDAIALGEEAAGAEGEPMRAALWKAANNEMEKSQSRLEAAIADSSSLTEALAPQQSAYQVFLRLRERETEVNRSQQQQQGQASGSQQQRQDQLDELDLEQAENRYETERQAQPQQSAERRTQMQVQNRLQELAQRQEDVNERLKELQTALQAADEESEREELRRQLKRLEEEQRQMLADMDELRQRMERPEVQSQMADQRQQLEQTRQDAQRAAEAASQGEVAQAIAAGTRAERQLEEMREQMRREGASQLAEELRQMRAEARTLARQQEAITNALANQDQPRRPSLSDTPQDDQTLDQLAAQRERTAALVDRATQLSQETEGSEPLVSRQLYDSLRAYSQDDAATVKQTRDELIRDGTLTQDLYDTMRQLQEDPKAGQALSLTAELVRAEMDAPAQQAARQAEEGLNQLRGGVEKAAEKILGDDTAALQAAEKELDALANALAQEASKGQEGQEGREGQFGSGEGGEGGERGDRSQQASRGADSEDASESQDPSDPQSGSESGEPGDRSQQASRGQAGDTPPGGEPGEGGLQASRGAGSEDASESQDPSDPQSGSESGEPGDRSQQASRGQAGDPSSPGQSGQTGESGDAPPEGESGEGGQPGESGQQASRGQPGQGQGGGQSPGGADQEGQPGQPGQGGQAGDAQDVADRIAQMFSGGGNAANGGRGGLGAPMGGEGFTEWSDRMREVEEMLEFPDLRNAVATARERARVLRQETRRAGEKPDWAVVELEILNPLVEVRKLVRDELRRRSTDDQLAPIDRDPVPDRFAEAVRRYYEELGRDDK